LYNHNDNVLGMRFSDTYSHTHTDSDTYILADLLLVMAHAL